MLVVRYICILLPKWLYCSTKLYFCLSNFKQCSSWSNVCLILNSQNVKTVAISKPRSGFEIFPR